MKKQLTVGALAMTALLVASPAAASADPVTPDKAVPSITTGALSQLVSYNGTASVTFTVKAGNALLVRRAAQLCTAPIGGDWTCSAATTSSSGRVTMAQRKLVAPLRMRLVLPESATTEAATSDTVEVRPQVTVAVTRRKDTMTVSLNVAANQYLVLKRQEGTRWVVDGFPEPVTATKTTVTGLDVTKKYQVTISDTATVRGATSKTV